LLTDLVENGDNIVARNIIKQCNDKYECNIHLSHISEYTEPKKIKMQINSIPEIDKNRQMQLERLLNKMQETTKNDFLSKIKRELFISCAKELNCNYIFTAETTPKLALNLLSNLSLGRGSQVQYDVVSNNYYYNIILICH
jgi:hypothetical protein